MHFLKKTYKKYTSLGEYACKKEYSDKSILIISYDRYQKICWLLEATSNDVVKIPDDVYF